MAEIEDTTPEVWRECPGFSDYSVSSMGRIRRDVTRHTAIAGRVLVCNPGVHGYVILSLVRDGKRPGCYVHRLVALAFIGEPPEGKPQVNHKNGVKADNRVENLEWVSPKENSQHASASGLMRHGEAHPGGVLTEDAVRIIRERRRQGEHVRVIAKDLNVSTGTVSLAANRLTWRHVE